MTKLSKDFLEKTKDILLRKKSALTEQLDLLGQEDTYSNADRVNSNSEDADEAYEDLVHGETEVKKKSLNDSIAKIDRAMYLMESGKYGFCDVCGQEISSERLEVYPEATTCLQHSA